MAIKPGVIGWNPKPIPVLPGKNVTGKVNLQTEKFDDLIDQQGVRVKVYRTSFCPRVKSIDGAEHEIDCPLCHGEGFVDRYCLETWAFIQTQSLEKIAQPEGMVDGNTVSATFQKGVELQYFTLVELLDFTEIFYERIKRQDGLTDVLKYPAVRINLLMDADGKEYFEGIDFQLDPNGNIRWIANRNPGRGVTYTINYETNIRFRAVRAVHNNRFAQISKDGQTHLIKMHEQWMLQKSYLVTRTDLAGQVIQPNKIRDADEED
jgi:hypothetical protein